MKRRNFLAAMLGAASAPAIVKAESLMKIVVPKQEIKLLNQNGIFGGHIGDMDVNFMYDHIVQVYEDGIVLSESQLRKYGFATYKKRAIEFGSTRYPLDLYENQHGHRFPDIGALLRA